MADGIKTKNEINIPFNIEFILIFTAEIKNPIIDHIENADKLASHVNFCKIIGITSIKPATIPKAKPFKYFNFTKTFQILAIWAF